MVTKVNSYFKCFGENRLADELNGLRYNRREALSKAMIKHPKNVFELPLLERAEMAMKAAMEKVIEEHVREGLPLYIWRDGKVVAVPAEELRAQSRL
jgi:hypothetical protein